MNYLKIAWFEYRRRIRSKWFLLGTFGMPLLVVGISLASGYMTGLDASVDTKYFGLIDETAVVGEKLSRALDERYAPGVVPPIVVAVSQGQFAMLQTQYDNLVAEKSLDGYFVIPIDFQENPVLKFYAQSSANIRLAGVVESELKDILAKLRAEALGLPEGTLEELFGNVSVDHYELGASDATETDELIVGYIAPFIFMFLLFLGIFTGGQLLMRAILEERSSRVIEVLLSTVTYNDLMAGKILGLGMLGLTQSMIYILAGVLAGNYYGLSVVTPTIALLYFVYFILGYLLYAGIYIGVGSLFDSEQEAQQAIQIITFIAILPMILWTLVIENPNSPLVNALIYLPPVTPFFMMIKIAVGETTITQVILTIILLMLSVVGSMRLSAKVFRTGILLYGKRVNLPEIIRWLKV